MPSSAKITKLLIDLTKATIDREIRWVTERIPRFYISATDDVVTNFFVTTYKGQKLAIFERRYTWFHGDTETSHWISDTRLAFMQDETVTWELTEQSSYLENLYTAARDSASNIDAVLDRLLK